MEGRDRLPRRSDDHHALREQHRGPAALHGRPRRRTRPPTSPSPTASCRRRGCEPHGVKITIQGSVNWLGSSGGTLRIAFQGQQLSSNATQVSFGGHDGMELVFDWADSMRSLPRVVPEPDGDGLVVGGKHLQDRPIHSRDLDLAAGPQLGGPAQALAHRRDERDGRVLGVLLRRDRTSRRRGRLNGITGTRATSPPALGAIERLGVLELDGVQRRGLHALLRARRPLHGWLLLGAGTLGNNGAVNGLTQTQFGTMWTAGDSYPCVYG